MLAQQNTAGLTRGGQNMTGRIITSTLTLTLAGLLGAAGLTMAQEPRRTVWGAPDLQGVWDFRTLTPLERPRDLGDKAFLTAEEAAEREQAAVDRNLEVWEREARQTEAGDNVGGYNNFWMDNGTRVIERTSLIMDPPNGRLPETTEAAQERRRNSPGSFTVEFPESYTDLSTYDRCILGFNAGPPITPAAYNQNVQIFQTPDHLVVLTEMVHTARIIPLQGQSHLDDSVGQWSGDSRGRWEGDTLVVDTANFREDTGLYGGDENLHLVERFTLREDGHLLYNFTVDDPTIWESPWSGEYVWKGTDERVYEYACHEGNYAMGNILRGARLLEQEEFARRGANAAD